jgi:yecA family protein
MSCRSIGPILVHPPFLTDDDYDELADWLEHRRIGITDIVELEGFLTALVIGPNAVSPIVWLPKVWGGRKPKLRTLRK